MGETSACAGTSPLPAVLETGADQVTQGSRSGDVKARGQNRISPASWATGGGETGARFKGTSRRRCGGPPRTPAELMSRREGRIFENARVGGDRPPDKGAGRQEGRKSVLHKAPSVAWTRGPSHT